MRRSSSVLLTLLLLILAAAPAAAAGPGRAEAPRAEHQRILNFWTPERMAAAEPRDFVRTPTGFKPAAKPEKPPGGGGGGSGSVVTGAKWTKGGAVNDSVGKVFFRMGGSYYTCSASIAQDNRGGHSLLLTAAHCAYDEVAGAFATEWMFIPAWGDQPTTRAAACDSTLYGCWTAQALVVHNGYASAGGFNTQATTHDYAFAIVGPGGESDTQLDAGRTAFALDVNGLTLGSQAYAFGYPAAGKYKGNTLTYCAGKTINDGYNSNLTWGVGCDMTGGSSGGPWFSAFSEATGSGKLSSLNSYGYSGIKNMYGPKFDSRTSAVYSAANSDTTVSNTIVP